MDAEIGCSRKTIRLDGVLDLEVAERLTRALAAAGDREVLVDLEHVREFHDLAVVHLARALAGRRSVAVVGLRQHHLRLLQYLGIPDAPAADLRQLA
jgi:anti-anti-sigma regulatory factor